MAACGGLLLGQLFGTGAGFRMNLQKLHEPRPAEENSGETIKDLPTFAKPMEKRAVVHGFKPCDVDPACIGIAKAGNRKTSESSDSGLHRND